MASKATLKYCKDLIDSGVSVDSAFKQVVALEDTLEALATREELKQEIRFLEDRLTGKLQAELHILKYSLIKSVVVLIYVPAIVALFLRWLGKI